VAICSSISILRSSGLGLKLNDPPPPQLARLYISPPSELPVLAFVHPIYMLTSRKPMLRSLHPGYSHIHKPGTNLGYPTMLMSTWIEAFSSRVYKPLPRQLACDCLPLRPRSGIQSKGWHGGKSKVNRSGVRSACGRWPRFPPSLAGRSQLNSGCASLSYSALPRSYSISVGYPTVCRPLQSF
jgi:hypothetical protein